MSRVMCTAQTVITSVQPGPFSGPVGPIGPNFCLMISSFEQLWRLGDRVCDTSDCVCVRARENGGNRISVLFLKFCYCFAGILTASLTRRRRSSGPSMTCAEDDGRRARALSQHRLSA